MVKASTRAKARWDIDSLRISELRALAKGTPDGMIALPGNVLIEVGRARLVHRWVAIEGPVLEKLLDVYMDRLNALEGE